MLKGEARGAGARARGLTGPPPQGAGKGKRVAATEAGGAAGGGGGRGGGGGGEGGPATLPLEVGTQIQCLWRDEKYHPVRIIERRRKAVRRGAAAAASAAGEGGEDPSQMYEYYVHYLEFNRRLDEWVTLERMDLDTAVDSKAEKGEAGGRTRNQKRKVDEHADDEHKEFDPESLREHEEFTKLKNIQSIDLGQWEMDTWYFSPFPPEYNGVSKLYFCEFDLCFFKRKQQLQRHMKKVTQLHPPGDEIYRDTYKDRDGNPVTLSYFEIDGKKEKIYCQNLCYLAKLFLDHKTLYYDVDLFLFYVLCVVDERGCHPVGYFSKESKSSPENYNLACILTFPAHQRKGYGKLLIAFSYALSQRENKVGTPERPLSDLGAVSYYSYWTRAILTILKNHEGTISIKELSDMTAIMQDDIISTLQRLQLIQYQKGQHVICAAPKLVERHLREAGKFRYEVDPQKLLWTPHQSNEGNAVQNNRR